jgi:hypothetical protein
MKDFLDLIYKGMSRAEIIKAKTDGAQRRSFLSAGAQGGKVNLTEEECRALCRACNNLEYHPGYEARVRQYRVSDDTVDRYGDIVRAKGISLANYRKNPVVQFAHDYSQPPIGNAIKAWYDTDQGGLFAWCLFFDQNIDTTGRADLIYRLVSSNAMNACSIGFIPLTYNDPQSDRDRKALGLGKYGVEYLTSDMTEFSPVPVPAHPKALQEGFEHDYEKSITDMIRSGHGAFNKKDVDILRKYPIVGSSVIDIFIKQLDDDKQIVVPEIPAEPVTLPVPKATEEPAESDEVELTPQQERELAEFVADKTELEDEELHAWAEKNGIDVSEAEDTLYSWAIRWVHIMLGGMSVQKSISADEATAAGLTEGIRQEAKEHTLNRSDIDLEIGKKIALDNIAAGDKYPSDYGKALPSINITLDPIAIVVLTEQIKTATESVRQFMENSSKAISDSTAQMQRDIDSVLSTARHAAALIEDKAGDNRLYDALGMKSKKQ